MSQDPAPGLERRDFLKKTVLSAGAIMALPSFAATVAPEKSSPSTPGGDRAPGTISAAVQPHRGRPTLFLNGTPVAPHIYALTDVPGGRWSWEELPRHNIGRFAAAGFRLFQLDLALEHVWSGPGVFDLETARRQVRGVLDVKPDAAVMLRLHVRPPRWWMAAHPEENTVYLDAAAVDDYTGGIQRIIEDDPRTPKRTSLASRRWFDEVGPMVRRFCAEFSTTAEGGAVFAIQVAGGVYGEWHYWGFITHEMDVAPCMIARFRAWLGARYGKDSALQQAWRDSAVTLASATVPGIEARKQTGDGVFRDPGSEHALIDYTTCQHEIVADAIEFFGRCVKESWSRPIVTAAFYGYFFAVFSREVAGGHLAVQQILRSPWIDCLCGPSTYYPGSFEAGDAYRSRGLTLSAQLHHKLWLDEMDQMVPLGHFTDPRYAACQQESAAKVRRNFSHGHTHGMGLWFYDFGPSGFQVPAIVDRHLRPLDIGTSGWWDAPELLADIGRTRALLAEKFREPFRTGADVLVVGDTASYHHTGMDKEANPVDHAAVNWTPLGLFRAGVVFDPVHLADLPLVDLTSYRVVVFLNVHKLSAEQRQWIREHVARDDRDLVWIYAPGYTDGQRNDPSWPGDVTQIGLTRFELTSPAKITVDPKLAPNLSYGLTGRVVMPLFAVNDPAAESLAHYAGTDRVAWARKKFSSHTAWYVGLPSFDDAVAKLVISQTQAHRYNERGDIFYSGGGILVLHTKIGGRTPLRLRNGKSLELDLPAGFATALLDPETGAHLL